MRSSTALALFVLGANACASRAAAPAPTPAYVDARAAWERLRGELPGAWAATGEHAGLVVRYRVVSGGSALLETFGAHEDRQTLSVYHPDGRALVMTHYCGQGNQARLRATAASGSSVRFEHWDATNVAAGGLVLHELSYVLGEGTLERVEVYRGADGAEDTTRYRFVRADVAAAPGP